MLKSVVVVALALIVYVRVGHGDEQPQIDAGPAPHEDVEDTKCADISKMKYSIYSQKYELRMVDPCVVKSCTKDGIKGVTLTCPENYQHDDSPCVNSESDRPGKCYMAPVVNKNKNGPWPICCPKWKKLCEGDVGFDANRVKDCNPQEDVLPVPGQ